LISTKDEDKKDKLIKAKLIIRKLEERTQKSSTKAIVNSIAAKLKIIEEFS